MSTRSLPHDVLHLVFHNVGFQDLLRFTQVSTLWRACGCRHPKYWKWLSLSDASSRPGSVALFLQRLNAKGDAGATVHLNVSLSALPGDLAAQLLSAFCNHIHRAEHLSLSLSPAMFVLFQPLLLCSAPLLRYLALTVNSSDVFLTPIRSIFNLHTQTRLEHIALIDVPLDSSIPPITQVLKTVTVFYFEYPAEMHDVLSWLPRMQTLLIAAPGPISSTESLRAVEPLKYLSLVCANWSSTVRALARSSEVLCLGIGARFPTPADAAEVLPQSDALCMCIKTQYSRDKSFSDTEWGAIAVSTPDLTVRRLFHHIDMAYMVSEPFMVQFIPASRIVKLVVSLTCGFMQICTAGLSFPRLDALCLGIGAIPGALSEWDSGALNCPVLRTVAFQAEREDQMPTITTRAMESFLEKALFRTTHTDLRIVLKDVALEGAWSTLAGHVTILHRVPRVHWLYDSGMNWMDDEPVQTVWMDVE